MPNLKVLDFIKAIDYTVNNVTGEECKLDPSEIFMAILLPKRQEIKRTYEDFKEIYAFDLFDPDIGVLKLKAKFFTELEYNLPTLKDFIDMVNDNNNLDLKEYEICISSENTDNSNKLYHLGEVVRFDYRLIDEYAYLIILLEYSLVEDNKDSQENIFKEMGFIS